MTTSPLPPDPYAALGLTKSATTDQVRASYRKLVLKAHPDRFPQATPEEKQNKTDEFHKIQQAYELLTDESRRRRHDERVHLAELKAELMREQAASARKSSRPATAAQTYTNAHATYAVPTYEPRPNLYYEDRNAKSTPQKAYDDDYTNSRFEPSMKHEDYYRSSPRLGKHEDPHRTRSRRASTAKEYEDVPRGSQQREERNSYDAKATAKTKEKHEKEKVRQVRSERQKATDKNRRQASEAKQYYTSPRPDVYTDPESSDNEYRRSVPISRKRADELPRRNHKDERSARRSREIDDEFSDGSDERSHNEFYYRQSNREADVVNYIKQAQRHSSDAEDRTRGSTRSSRKPVAPPAPQPPQLVVSKDKSDAPKRSSASKKPSTTRASPPRETRSSRREKMPEILEPEKPSRRSAYDSTRARPGLKTADSAPPKIDPDFHTPVKSQTWSSRPDREKERDRDRQREREKPPSGMRRAHTTTLESMVSGDRPQRSGSGTSKLRRSETARDFESDSDPETPIAPRHEASPAFTTSRFQYFEEPDDMEGPRIFKIEPEHDTRRSSPRARDRTRSRDVSPMGVKRPSMPGRSSASHRVPQRSSTFTDGVSSSPKPSPRVPSGFGSSGRRPELFGEVLPERPAPATSFSMADINWAQPVDKSNIQYSSRRKSPSSKEKERNGRDSDRERSRERSGRDSYNREGLRHGPSGLSRQASAVKGY